MTTPVLFIDIETTGLNPDQDIILEVYAEVFDLDNIMDKYKPSFYWLIDNRSWNQYVHHYIIDDLVRDMHAKSNLFRDITMNNTEVELPVAMKAFLQDTFDDKVVFAGRSVHFDLSFFRAKGFAEYLNLHHRVFDIRSITEFFKKLTGQEGVEQSFIFDGHRALPDVKNDIELYRHMFHSLSE